MRNIIYLFSLFSVTACGQHYTSQNTSVMSQDTTQLSIATLGAGCFWCVEAIFQRLKGVEKVISGYSGGKTENPTYKEICTGLTGHAEVVQVFFDPDIISYEDLLEVFFSTHDPTQLNRQGNDVGTQYRSVIFYHNEQQRQIAEAYKQKINESKLFDKPVVTEITAFTRFYPAEKYHQNYFNENKNQPYCIYVISPKIEKFEKMFQHQLK